ncbi:MAG: fibronectin type III domain-containing protein, partial [Ignavibacteriales bacterium]
MRRLRRFNCLLLLGVFLTVAAIGGGWIPSAMALTAPTDFKVTVVSSTQADLSWTDNASDEEGYVIIREGIAKTNVFGIPANFQSYSLNGLQPGATYTFRLAAEARDNRAYANPVTVTMSVESISTYPDAPSSLSATAARTNSIWVAWTNVYGELGYALQRKTGSEGAWENLDTLLANEVTYMDEGLSSGKTYYYRVRAFNEWGYSDWSPTSSDSPDSWLQAPYSLNASSDSLTSIKLTWSQKSINENGFIIQRKKGQKGDWAEIAMVYDKTDTYTDSQLLPGQMYFYRVQAFADGFHSAWSTTASAATFNPPLRPPAALRGVSKGKAVYLFWT